MRLNYLKKKQKTDFISTIFLENCFKCKNIIDKNEHKYYHLILNL